MHQRVVMLECCVCRVVIIVIHSTVSVQDAGLAVAVAAAGVIVIPGMSAVGHVRLAIATDATTTADDVAVVVTDAHVDAGAVTTDDVHTAGHRPNQKASKNS